MLFFSIKQMLRLREAIFGRREPHALACGVAAGFCWGLIPHGNLIAVALLLVIFSLRVNHGMAALVALVTTLLAGKLDPVSHALGYRLLTAPGLADFWSVAWGMPLVPWTDLNNTVVLGSVVIAVAALLPSYLLTYPIFRRLAPRSATEPLADEMVPVTESGLIEDGKVAFPAAEPAAAVSSAANPAENLVGQTGFDSASSTVATGAVEIGELEPWSPLVTTEQWIDTRIEVVRLRPIGRASIRPSESAIEVPAQEAAADGSASRANTAIESPGTTEITSMTDISKAAKPATAAVVDTTTETTTSAIKPENRTGHQPSASPVADVGGETIAKTATPASGSSAGRPAVPPANSGSVNRMGVDGKGRDAASQPAVIRERPKTQTLNYLLRQLRDSNEGRAA